MQRFLIATFAIVGLSVTAIAASEGSAEYAGGTVDSLAGGKKGTIEIGDSEYLAFYAKTAQVRVRYDHINLIEYGQKVDRRLALAIVISPMFLLSKSRKHFLTVGYMDENGKQQALVFRVNKDAIRATLAGLEARTGLKVQYQDEEAQKAGKG